MLTPSGRLTETWLQCKRRSRAETFPFLNRAVARVLPTNDLVPCQGCMYRRLLAVTQTDRFLMARRATRRLRQAEADFETES